MFTLNKQGRPELYCAPAERRYRAKSRNSIVTARSNTLFTLTKSSIRPVTPIRRESIQKNSKLNISLTAREKSLVNQNIKLKKENEELIRLLKKSRLYIKEEVRKYKPENIALKNFALVVWPWIETRIDEELKQEIEPNCL